jgi:F-type H+-transporting ATPase subunit delta
VIDGQSIVTGMAGRYASALFALALDTESLDRVMSELDEFAGLLDESDDLRRLVRSPVFSSDEQGRALSAVLTRAEIDGLTANFLGLVVKNRRLFAIRDMIDAFRALLADHRGETTAEVTAAQALDEDEIQALKAAIKEAVGTDVVVKARVDTGLIGGLIVKVGSRQIDTSLRTKLNNLNIALKEVG